MKLSTFIDKEYLPHAERTLKPKTVAEYRRLLTGLVGLGDMDLGSVRRRDVDKSLEAVRKRAPTVANRLCAALSSVYRLANRWEYCDTNPCHGAHRTREKARDRYLSSEEVARLKRGLDRLDYHEAAFVKVLLYTGARPGELQNLGPDDLKPETLELQDSKTGRRTVYLPEQARLPLRLYGHRFASINTQTLTRRLRRASKIQDLRLYDLRHTFASNALAAGVTLEQIGQLLGHSQAQTTKRYAHLMPETGSAAAAKAAAAIG